MRPSKPRFAAGPILHSRHSDEQLHPCSTARTRPSETSAKRLQGFVVLIISTRLSWTTTSATLRKGFPHNADGEVDASSYRSLLRAVESENPSDFESIPLAGDRNLANPQAGLAFDIQGRDPFSLTMPPAPKFSSRENAAEIAENYWMAILRDVPFEDYSTNEFAQAAAADLTLFGDDFKGPKDKSGTVTPELLFRGLTPGDEVGPYISQFFWLNCPFGSKEVNQKMRTVLSIGDGGSDYMTDFPGWLQVQRGFKPANSDLIDPVMRYIRSGRDIGQFVHNDVLFQAYFQAFLIITQNLRSAVDPGNPYLASGNQDGFVTFGDAHIGTLLCEVTTRALKAVWNQKWMVHRRLRPEVFAARIDRTLNHGAGYPVDQSILDSLSTKERLGGYMPSVDAFLPMAYPEGSPMHPSYGAGHATVAGACVTILKAFYDESAVVEFPVAPNSSGTLLRPYGGETLTVGGELNKLANNISIGRNIAGVHWRSDGTESLRLGEEVAISVLRDHFESYNEDFGGFQLTKFDGTQVTVS